MRQILSSTIVLTVLVSLNGLPCFAESARQQSSASGEDLAQVPADNVSAAADKAGQESTANLQQDKLDNASVGKSAGNGAGVSSANQGGTDFSVGSKTMSSDISPASNDSAGDARLKPSAANETDTAGGEAKSASSDDDKEKSNGTIDEKRPYSDPAVKHYNRGVELHQSGFLNQAIEEYKAAIDADPRMEEGYSNLGLIYAAQRNYSKAVDAFNKAIVLKPGRPTTLNGLGTVLYARGKVADAMAKWKEAIASDPNFASAYFNMGNAYESEKDYKTALDSYVKAIKLNPNMADAFYRIGTLLNRDKHLAQASLLLSKAVELAPDADFVRDAKKQMSQLSSQSDQPDEPDLEMNVMPPQSGGASSDSTAKDTGSTSSQNSNAEHSKSGQKVDMFIQQSQTNKSDAK